MTAAALLFLAGGAYAQTATATASATIVTPISITKNADMNFGNVAVNATLGGTVTLSPQGDRTKADGVTLPASSGTVAAASFTVSGEAGYTYSITLPAAALEISSGANSMTVSNFTSFPSGTGTLTDGTQTLSVGATLNVAAGQAEGSYASETPFSVTVNYN